MSTPITFSHVISDNIFAGVKKTIKIPGTILAHTPPRYKQFYLRFILIFSSVTLGGNTDILVHS